MSSSEQENFLGHYPSDYAEYSALCEQAGIAPYIEKESFAAVLRYLEREFERANSISDKEQHDLNEQTMAAEEAELFARLGEMRLSRGPEGLAMHLWIVKNAPDLLS